MGVTIDGVVIGEVTSFDWKEEPPESVPGSVMFYEGESSIESSIERPRAPKGGAFSRDERCAYVGAHPEPFRVYVSDHDGDPFREVASCATMEAALAARRLLLL